MEDKLEFGPYEQHPIIFIDNFNGNTLKRTLYEDVETEVKGKLKMTTKQWVKYCLFLYNPPKNGVKTTTRKFGGIEELAKDITSFHIDKRDDKYYIVAE